MLKLGLLYKRIISKENKNKNKNKNENKIKKRRIDYLHHGLRFIKLTPNSNRQQCCLEKGLQPQTIPIHFFPA